MDIRAAERPHVHGHLVHWLEIPPDGTGPITGRMTAGGGSCGALDEPLVGPIRPTRSAYTATISVRAKSSASSRCRASVH